MSVVYSEGYLVLQREAEYQNPSGHCLWGPVRSGRPMTAGQRLQPYRIPLLAYSQQVCIEWEVKRQRVEHGMVAWIKTILFKSLEWHRNWHFIHQKRSKMNRIIFKTVKVSEENAVEAQNCEFSMWTDLISVYHFNQAKLYTFSRSTGKKLSMKYKNSNIFHSLVIFSRKHW